jgi:hypothetical protein
MNLEIDKKNLSLKKEIKRQLVEWASHSSAHGIAHVAKSKNVCIGILWALCFSLSTSYCFYTMIKSFLEYNSNGVAIKIERIQQLPASFPAITFCNISKFN